MSVGLTLFETAIGSCGIAWRGDLIVGLQLPEGNRDLVRLRRRHPGAEEDTPPTSVAHVIDDIVALLAGESRDFADIELDLDQAPAFNRRVYNVARAIPAGATATYGEVAVRIGEPGAAQAVGRALGQNPFPIVVPCHRVLAAGGRIGGFSAHGGVQTKRLILAIESRHAVREPGLFD